LSRFSDLPPEQRAYRRLAPKQFDRDDQFIDPQAFELRDHEEGLSLFRGDFKTPRGVLEEQVEFYQAKRNSESSSEQGRAERFLRTNGDTPEALLAKGWGVAGIATGEFDREGLYAQEPDSTGHFEVKGSQITFAELSLNLSEASELLSIDDCLRE
jgi:hypothetical protein